MDTSYTYFSLADGASGFAWIMFGLLLFGIACGILWGVIRGFKRSLFRLAIVLVASITAFFTAPLIARAFGAMAQSTMDGLLNQDPTTAAAIENFAELNAVMHNLPGAILSLFIFIALFYVLRFLSWIIYAIFARKVAPKEIKHRTGERTANGFDRFEMRPAKRHRLLGMLVGVVQGLVIFFFIFIPVNGGLSILNSVDSYVPEFTTVANAQEFDEQILFNEDVNALADLYIEVRELNETVRGSAYGFISRFTGMQWLSGPMFGYLTTIRTGRDHPNISLRRDVITMSELHKDFLAIYANFIDEDGEEKDINEALKNLPAVYYNAIRATINKLFEINAVRMLADAGQGLAGFMRETDFLEDFRIYEPDLLDNDGNPRPQSELDEIEALNLRFNDAILSTLELVNANFIERELINLTHIIESLFRETREFNGEQYNLFETLRYVLDSFDDDSVVDDASARLAAVVGNNAQTSLANQVLTRVFNMGIFSQILTTDGNESTIDLVRVPLMLFLDLEESDVDFPFTWNQTANHLTTILINVTEVLPAIVEMINAEEDMLEVIADMDENILENIGEILNILTMEINVSPVLRTFVRNFIQEQEFDIDLGVNIDVADVLEGILDALDAGDIDWVAELSLLHYFLQVAQMLADFDPNGNLTDILDSIFDQEFLELLQNSVLGPVVVDVINEALNDENLFGDIFDGNIAIELDSSEEGFKYSLQALMLIGSGITDVVEGLQDGNMDLEDIIELLDSTGNMLHEIATMMPDGSSPITIFIPSDQYDVLEDILEGLDNWDINSGIIVDILNMFRPFPSASSLMAA